MRFLKRLSKPQILIQKEFIWRDSFLNPDIKRPDNNKYGHPEIKTELHRISFNKCFYSEVKFVSEKEGQIDHYIEVSEDRSLAFDWENLFLSHKDCNMGKPNNLIIPVINTLNPFIHSDEEIENNLTFEDECITAKNNSILGLNTIKKYKLNSPLFDILRSKKLREFEQLLIHILTKTTAEGGRNLNDIEKEMLFRFAQKDHSFSLMFKILLQKHFP